MTPALLLTRYELADRLDVNPDTITTWSRRYPHFPSPAVPGAKGRVKGGDYPAARWRWGEVREWVREERPKLLRK